MQHRLVAVFLIAALAGAPADLLAGNLHIRDTPGDTGAQPNLDSGLIYLSPDIWVRKTPDPAYQPFRFPDAGPMPWTPAPHENAEYRDPRLSVPNWVYVRVRNTGTTASTGTERLRLYWAKASTGLGWSTQWVDYLASNCGPTKVYGMEITKERKRADGPNTTAAERTRFVNAILSTVTTTDPALRYSDASYWHKQDEVHELGPTNRHGQPAFLPWHREMINRFEILLQQHDPLVKLLYWDWTTSPMGLFTPAFMGSSGLGTSGVSIGAPFMPTLAPPTVIRRLEAASPTTVVPDSSLLANASYPGFRSSLESFPHNDSHGYIGGLTAGGLPIGNMSDINTAAEDPFFFLLHTNADRIWARWQRNPAPANVVRLYPDNAYYGNSLHASITDPMQPWNGTGPAIEPWTTTGGHIYAKTPKHPSVVSPPVYDNAPLVVPVLNPGEAVVIQVPWYPPNPVDYSCFGADEGHFCLLARIESGPAPMFGMAFLEGTDLATNVRNNRDIAWKNITVEEFSGVLKVTSAVVRNIFPQETFAALRFIETPDRGTTFRQAGRVVVDLAPELYQRWVEGGSVGRGVRKIVKRRVVRSADPASDAYTGTNLELTGPDAALENIRLEPGEAYPVDLRFELARNYQPVARTPAFDVVQNGTPANRNAFVGGQRFELDLSRIVLLRKADDEWRVLDDDSDPGPGWPSVAFDDSKWKVGRAELGSGDEPETTIDRGPEFEEFVTTYFRRAFEVTDPTLMRNLLLRLKRDDGAAVYLNGTEIHRVNLPMGTVTRHTLAGRRVEGVEEEMFFPAAVDPRLLRPGKNVLAVELHQHSQTAEDASFDAELTANRVDATFPPDGEFAAGDGALVQFGRSLEVSVDALDSDGRVANVSLFVDEQLVGTDPNAPFTFTVPNAALGSHRVRAVVTDDSNQQSVVHTSFTVLTNTPPLIQLTQPQDRAELAVGQPITATALASDPGGAVERVEFYLQSGTMFGAPETLIGTAFQPPYSIALPALAPGHYMLIAVAWDNGGEDNTDAVHFMVGGASHGH
jgi:hypothetical protein